MFDNTIISKGYEPMFALTDKSIIEIITLDLQLSLFNKRTKKSNIKTQILESDNSNYLLILFIKDKTDNDSLEFVLENMVDNVNLISVDKIKNKRV